MRISRIAWCVSSLAVSLSAHAGTTTATTTAPTATTAGPTVKTSSIWVDCTTNVAKGMVEATAPANADATITVAFDGATSPPKTMTISKGGTGKWQFVSQAGYRKCSDPIQNLVVKTTTSATAAPKLESLPFKSMSYVVRADAGTTPMFMTSFVTNWAPGLPMKPTVSVKNTLGLPKSVTVKVDLGGFTKSMTKTIEPGQVGIFLDLDVGLTASLAKGPPGTAKVDISYGTESIPTIQVPPQGMAY